jgi:hypothetical protein
MHASTKELLEKDKTVKVIGNPDLWVVISKVYSEEGMWAKSTKAMNIEGRGVLVQVSTQMGDQIAEALTFVPYAMVEGPFNNKATGKDFFKIIGTVKDD